MPHQDRTLMQSVFGLKCPRCREGDLFISSSSFNFKSLSKMPNNCPTCDQLYLPEPGFYYGAMFISYIICGFWFLGFIAICMFAFKLTVDTSFLLLGIMIVVLFGWIFRISRSIWIHINVKYDPSQIRKT